MIAIILDGSLRNPSCEIGRERNGRGEEGWDLGRLMGLVDPIKVDLDLDLFGLFQIMA